jgi:hypothetical protein
MVYEFDSEVRLVYLVYNEFIRRAVHKELVDKSM